MIDIRLAIGLCSGATDDGVGGVESPIETGGIGITVGYTTRRKERERENRKTFSQISYFMRFIEFHSNRPTGKCPDRKSNFADVMRLFTNNAII